jgi:hypothetical protein
MRRRHDGEREDEQGDVTMTTKALTDREILLRKRAARLLERGLPDQVGHAYGVVPLERADLASDDTTLRDRARAALVKQGVLTAQELETLSADQALETARQRVRDQIAALEEQEQSNRTGFGKAPRTLRPG